MSVESADAEMINLSCGFVLMSDGESLPITNFLNEDGEECDGDDDAVAVVAGRDDYGYVAIRLDFYEVTIH